MSRWFFSGMAVVILLGFPAHEIFSAQEIVTIGSVSSTPKEEVEKFQPFIDYVANHLKKFNIHAGRVLVTATVHEMVDEITKKNVDLYLDSPFSAVRIAKVTGAKPFLRRWKKGVSDYSGVFFVRKDSGIESLSDLNGKIIAFKDRYSTSGYLLPKATLLKEHFKLSAKKTEQEIVLPDEVSYLFSFDEENAIFWVLRKKVACGIVDNESFVEKAHASIKDLKILKETIKVPRHVMLHRGDLDLELVQALTEVLTHMHEDAEGKRLLGKFEQTIKFDLFPNGADKDLEPVKDLAERVEQEI